MLFPRPICFRRTAYVFVCVLSWLFSLLPAFAQLSPPQATGTLPNLDRSGANAWAVGDTASVSLYTYFQAMDVPVVEFTFVSGTSLVSGSALASGTHTVDIELSDWATPVSVANFLSYVSGTSYDNTFIHRSGSLEPLGIIQGGGFAISDGTSSVTGTSDLSASTLVALTGTGGIQNESDDTLRPNARGTISMARTSDPNSATTQWFFNTADNSTNLRGAAGTGSGYAVFGKVLGNGMDVIDQIYGIPPQSVAGLIDGNIDGAFNEIPLRNAPTGSGTGNTIPRSDLVMLASARAISTPVPDRLQWTVASDRPDIVAAAAAADGTLSLTAGSVSGTANISVTATDYHGAQTSGTFAVVSQLRNPLLTGTLPAVTGLAGIDQSVNIAPYFQALDAPGTVVQMKFTGGALGSGTSVQPVPINIALSDTATPITVANFLSYVQSQAYTNSFIHRTASTEGLGIIQGGGFKINSDTADLSAATLAQVPVALSIVNESSTTRPNARGTIAMARTSDVNSATNQWFINTADNTTNLGGADGAGYTVFGTVLGSGMDVADQIFGMSTASLAGRIDSNIDGAFTEVPLQNQPPSGTDAITIPRADLVTVTSAQIIPALTFSAQSDNPDVQVTGVSADGVVTLSGAVEATANITVTATDLDGLSTSATFPVTVHAAGALITTASANLTVSGTDSLAVVHVLRSGTGAATVQYQTVAGTASAGVDYTGTSGNLVFSGTVSDRVVSIPLLTSGSVASPGKTFTLQLSISGSAAVLGAPSSTAVTIVDVPPASPSVIQFSDSGYDFNAGGGFAALRITRTGATSGSVSAVFSCWDDTGVTGTDYTGLTQIVTFLPGDSAPKTVIVPILSSTLTSGPRTFNAGLSNPMGGAVLGSNSTATVTLWQQTNPEGEFAFPFTEYRCSGTGTATVSVQRINTTGTTPAATVYYTTTNGSARDGIDYTAVHNTLNFGVGESLKTFTVPIIASGTGSTVGLHLVAASTGAALARFNTDATLIISRGGSAIGTVQFQQAVFTGTQGQTTPVTLTRTGSNTGGISAYVEFLDNSAVAGPDYSFAGSIGRLVKVDFLAGNSTATLPLTSNTESVPKTFTLKLASVDAGFKIGSPDTANVTIAGIVAFSSTNFPVSSSGTAALVGVTRTGTNAGESVVYSTQPGTAIPGTDYTTVSGTLTFAGGEATKAFIVPMLVTSATTDKSLGLHLSQPSAGLTTGSDAQITIAHDPQTDVIQLSASSYHVDAGNPLTVTLVHTGSGTPTVTVDLIDGTGILDSDYVILDGTNYLPRVLSFTFASGSTATFSVATGAWATGKTFKIGIGTSSTGCAIGTPAGASVLIDSQAFDFSPTSYRVSALDSQAFLYVTRTGTAAGQTVVYTTVNGTAMAGSDFTTTSGTLTFAANEQSKLLTIPILPATGTADRTFTVQLSSSGIVNAFQGTATVVIDHNVQPQTVGFASSSYPIALGGTSTVTLTRSGTSGVANAQVLLVDSTALQGTDYFDSNAVNGVETVVFADGTDTATMTITASPSAIGKTFSLKLLAVDQNWAVGANSSASAVIADLFQFAVPTYVVSGSGAQAVLAVTRSGTAAGESVAYSTGTGTAVAGTDFTLTTGTLTFAANEQFKTFSVPLLPTSGTANVSFAVQLTSLAADATAGPDATVVIANDPATQVVQFQPASYSISQGGTASVVLTRTDTTGTPTATVRLEDGTALLGTDYSVTGATGNLITVSFPEGSGSAVIPVVASPASNGKSLGLQLLTVSDGCAVGMPSTASVAIADLFQFAIPTCAVSASDSQALLAVTRSGTAAGESVAYSTGTGTAVEGTDFTLTTGTLTFAANEQFKTFTVPLLPTLGTSNLSFPVHLVSLAADAVAGPDANVVLAHDPATQVVQFQPASYQLAQNGTTNVTLTRTDTVGAATATLWLNDSSAVQGTDYTVTGTSGRTIVVSFPDGSGTATLPIAANPNSDGKALSVTLIGVSDGCAIGAPSTASVSIAELIQFSPASYLISSSGAQATQFLLQVTRSGATAGETVVYTPVDGTAVAGSDYLLTGGTLTFAVGVQSLTIPVTIPVVSALDDRAFTVHLSSTSPVSVTGSDASVVIAHNPATPVITLSASNNYLIAPNAPFQLQLNRTGDPTLSATVTVGIQDETAVQLADYTVSGANGNTADVTFAAGSSTALLTGTAKIEASGKSFGLRLISASPGNAIGTPNTATVTATPMFLIQINSYSVLASDSSAVIAVRRTAADTAETVQYSTGNGTAISGTHYLGTSGTLSFAPGVFVQEIPISLLSGSFTGTATFNVTLSNPSGVFLIRPDRASTTVNIVYGSPSESCWFGSSNYVFDSQVGGVVTVLRTGTGALQAFNIEALDGTAISTRDYSTVPSIDSPSNSVALEFQPGQVSASLIVLGNPIDSPKTFRLRMPGSSDLPVGQPSEAIVTLIPNGSLQLSSTGYRVDGRSSEAVVTVIRRGGTVGAVTVGYSTSDGPVISGTGAVPVTAVSGTDYVATSGTLTFADGVVAQDVHLPLKPTNFTAARAFTVTLSNPGGGAVLDLPTQSTVTIVKNAIGGTVSFAQSEYRVNALGLTVPQQIAIVRDLTDQAAIVNVTALDNSAHLVAISGSSYSGDYELQSGTSRIVPVAFKAGESVQYVTVSSSAAKVENLILQLNGVEASGTSAATAVGSPGTATVTLVPNASQDLVEFASPTFRFLESDTNALVGITRSGTDGTVSATYSTADGTAISGTDYTGTANGTVTFLPGEIQKTIPVPLLATSSTSDRTFSVSLLNVTGSAALGANDQTAVTIVKNAPLGVFTFAKTAYNLDAAGFNQAFGIKILRSATGQAATVYVNLVDGSAQLNTDYVAYNAIEKQQLTGQRIIPVPFAAGDSEGNLEILAQNTVTKAFTVQLVDSSEGSAVGLPDTATVTLAPFGADGVVEFSSATCRVQENAGSAKVTVNLTGTTMASDTVSVVYATTNGTAFSGTNYAATSGTLIFNPGETQKTITVPLIATSAATAPERTFTVNLLSLTGSAAIGAVNTTTVTIVKNITGDTFSFDQSLYNFASAVWQSVPVLRSGTGIGTAESVYVELLDGTGKLDLTGTTGYTTATTPVGNVVKVDFAPGQSGTSFAIGAYSGQGTTTMSLRLIDGPPGSGFGSPSTVNVIFDGQALQFASTTYRVGPAASGTAFLTVTRGDTSSSATSGTCTIDFATADGTAKSGVAYTGTHGTLTFLPGVKALDIPVKFRAVTSPLSFSMTLSNPTGGNLGAQSVSTVAIVNSAPGGTIQFTSADYPMQASSSALAGSVILTRNGTGAAIAYVEVIDKTGTLGAYLSSGGLQGGDFALFDSAFTAYGNRRVVAVSFAAGQATAYFSVYAPISSPESVGLRIVSVSPGCGIGALSEATINVASNGLFTFESTLTGAGRFVETSGFATIPVAWSGSNAAASVGYSTLDLTAKAGANYTRTTGTLTFQPGQTVQNIVVPIQKSTATGDRTFMVALSSPSGGAGIGTPYTFVATIAKSGTGSVFRFDRNNYEFDTGTQQEITIRRTNFASAAGVYVAFLDPDNAIGSSGILGLNFSAGQEIATVALTGVSGNGDKQMTVWLVGATADSAIGAPSSAIVSFLDGYYPALVQFAPPAYTVTGTSYKVTVAVTRSGTDGTVTVPYTTSAGTARAGIDFVAQSGTVTFQPGQTLQSFSVNLILNQSATTDRSFSVKFTAPPTGRAIAGAQDTATITLSKAVPKGLFTLSASSYSFDTAQNAPITIYRSGAARPASTVYFMCQDGTGVYNLDYFATSQVIAVSFAAGQTYATVNLNAKSGHGNTTMSVHLIGSSEESGIGALNSAQVTFIDTATAAGVVEFFPSLYSVNASARLATVGLVRTGTAGTVVVTCSSQAGSPVLATSAIASGTTLTFNPGEKALVFTVPFIPPVTGDGMVKLVLTPKLGLSSTAVIGVHSAAWITLNHAATTGLFSFASNNYRFLTGINGTITVVRSGTSTAAAAAYVRLADGTGVLGSDYTTDSSANGRVIEVDFAAGQKAATFTVRGISGRGDKYLWAVLIGSTGDSGIGAPASTGISFADASNLNGVVEFSPVNYYENEGNAPMTLTLTRSGTSGTATVGYKTIDGTARNGVDYVATTGTATFQPGSAVATIPVRLLYSSQTGATSRGFTVTLTSAGGGATLGRSIATTATVTVVEAYNVNGVFRFEKPAWSFNRSSGWAELVVTRSSGTTGPVDLSMSVQDGTPVAKGVVYQWPANLATKPIHFGPGQDRQSVFIPLLSGTIPGTRTFTARLWSPSAGIIGVPMSATVTAVDATSLTQPSVEFASTQYRVNDDDGTVTVTARLSGSASDSVSAPFTVQPASALPGTDFNLLAGANVAVTGSTSGTITFPLGTTSVNLSIGIKHAPTHTAEKVKLFGLQLGQPSTGAALLAQTAATVTIVNSAAPDGVFELLYPAYPCDIDCGAVTVTVVRSGTGTQLSGSARVIVATEDGTGAGAAYDSKGALNGHPDYAGIRQAVVFGTGEWRKTVPIQITTASSCNFLVHVESIDRLDSTSARVATKAAIGAHDRSVVTVTDTATVGTASIDFDRPSYDVNDTDGSLVLTVRRSDGRSGSTAHTLQVDYAIVGGAAAAGLATPGLDYTAIRGNTGTLTFTGGQGTSQIQITLLHRPLATDRKFTVTLSNPRDLDNPLNPVQFLANNPVAVTIRGSAKPYGQFEFDRASYTAFGENNSMDLLILRNGDLSRSATVSVQTGDRTAIAGTDYLERVGSVTFAIGEAHAQIQIPFRSATNTREFVVGLYPTATGATGAVDTATVTLSTVSMPSIEFDRASYSVDDNEGELVVNVVNYVGYTANDRVTVQVSTYVPSPLATESAIPYTDFTPTASTLVFSNQSLTGSVSIPIRYHSSTLSNRTFYVRLTKAVNTGDPAKGVQLLSNILVPVTLVNVNHATGGVYAFSSPEYSVSRASGTAVIRLVRYGDTSLTSEVVLAVVPNSGTAKPGVDYAKGSGTSGYPEIGIAFAAGQSYLDVDFSVFKNLVVGTPSRTAYFELLMPTSGGNGAVVGSRNAAVLTITP